MQLTGFLPGRFAIESFGNGGFRFGGMSHRGSLFILPSGMRAFEPPEPFRHSDELYAAFIAEAAGIDVLLVGAGHLPLPFPEPLRWRFRDAAISADVMTTASAASTYNLLLSENRRVAAALVAVG
ncbi:MAG: Mth938-like domain-containing protein [Beijerinckiaceae bacterium]